MKSYQKIILFITLIGVFSVIFVNLVEENQTAHFSDEMTVSEKNQAEKNLQIAESYGNLPLHFEPNQGQTDESVKFFSRGKGYGIFPKDKPAPLF